MSFPDSSIGKESACNAGDPSSILGSGRSTGEGTGYPLQYSWASLVAQLVKNLSAMRETWVRSLGWEDALEKGKATHSRILAWRTPWTIQSYSSYFTHSWVLFTHFPSFKYHAHTDDPQTHVSSSSLSTELLTWIFYRNLNCNTPTMESSASPYAHTMEIRASI